MEGNGAINGLIREKEKGWGGNLSVSRADVGGQMLGVGVEARVVLTNEREMPLSDSRQSCFQWSCQIVKMKWFAMMLITCVIPSQVAAAPQTTIPEEAVDGSQTVGERPEFSAEDLEFFEKKIRPILVDHCFDCHGPDSEIAGGLSVASRVDLLRGGDSGAAISPGDSMGSLLIEALRYGDRVQMPPDGELPIEIQADFIKWIERKAAWPRESDVASKEVETFDLEQRRDEHWAWQPVQHPAIPSVHDESWPRQPLDHFILKRLEQEGLSPAEDASPRDWLRRVRFDLTGLPPTLEELEQLKSASEGWQGMDAAQRQASVQQWKSDVADRLLANPAFGEHWGRHWLDLVRYAETYGHEFDYPILNAYEYRDYIIRAFNQDVSYQRLVAEHVAGDLLPNPREHAEEGFNESIIGTSFWYLGEANHAPVDSLIDEAGRIDNQIDVLGKAFLGMTVACARCHDHKFDAISARDYHAWFGVIQGMRRDVGVLDAGGVVQKHYDASQQLRQDLRQWWSERLTDQPQLRWTRAEVQFLLARIDRIRSLETVEINQGASPIAGTSGVAGAEESELTESVQAALTDLAQSLVNAAGQDASQSIGPNNPVRHLLAYAQRPATRPITGWWQTYQKTLRTQVEAADTFTNQAVLVADGTQLREEWKSTGWAFRNPPENQGSASRSLPDLTPWGVDSRYWSEALPGTLRSPTFQITSPNIHLRLRGKHGKVRLVIDSYRMNQFSALLFADCLVTEDNDSWHWRTLQGDIGRYVGHRAFLELVDEGPGGIAVSEIWMGEGSPASRPTDLTRYLADAEVADDDDFVDRMVEILEASPALADARERNDNAGIAWSDEESREFQEWWRQSLTARDASETDHQDWLVAGKVLEERRSRLNAASLPLRKLYVATAGTPEDQPIYVRGNTRNLGEIVPRGNLQALQREPDTSDVRLANEDPTGRLSLANDIASAENPLTSRVYVNRIWHWMMGRGIVGTADNFGVLGEDPTHPELLDYLATDLVEKEWSTKAMLRSLVLSRTYGLSSQGNDEAFAADPANRLWHSALIKRRDAESLRDSMLVISGQYQPAMYGPSVPVYLTDFMQGRGRPTQSGPMDGQGRRSIYLQVRRNFMNPFMLVFDSPVPLSTAGRRTQSNVPAQSLALMNDPLVEHLAGKWADTLMAEIPPDETGQHLPKRLDRMYLATLSRLPEESERRSMMAFVNQHGDQPDTWQTMAHALFNLKEFLYLR